MIEAIQVLDIRAIWIKELAAALAKEVPTTGWMPQIEWLGRFQSNIQKQQLDDPRLEYITFPLQRGFYQLTGWPLFDSGNRIARWMAERCKHPRKTLLLCTTPHYCCIAKHWPGPTAYFMSDLYYAWGAAPEAIRLADRKMCEVVKKVFVVSERCRTYLLHKVGCESNKIHILPMATRHSNTLTAPSTFPAPLPKLVEKLPRPIIGVIGNLAANVDWCFLEKAIKFAPAFTWLFIGGWEMPIAHPEQATARQRVLKLSEGTHRIHFTGTQPYGELQSYSRAFDVALFPYRKRESTYSGSSTRYYEHLPAGRPILATPGFADLLTKPFVTLVNTPEELRQQLDVLRSTNFHSNEAEAMWQASQKETWEERARLLLSEVG